MLEKRVNLIRLVHEPQPEVPALQAQKFQRINQEMLSFQSILGEVIDEFNNYFEGLQGMFQFLSFYLLDSFSGQFYIVVLNEFLYKTVSY